LWIYIVVCYRVFWCFFFFFSSRRRHTRCYRDWSSDVCSSDLFPIKSLPSATAIAEGYWPVGINPRTFDFAASAILSAFLPPRAFSESVTTATALLCAFATYKIFSRSEERRVGKECRSMWSLYI